MQKRIHRLNVDLLRVDGLEEKEKLVKEPVEAVDPTYNDAINSHKNLKDNLEDSFKEQTKETEKFVKENDKRDVKVKGTKEMKKLKLSESLFEAVAVDEEEDIESEIDPEEDIYYKKKRAPLADIIMCELSVGEVVYVLRDGKYRPQHKKGLGINSDDIGVGSDSKGDYILARVGSEEEVESVKALANSFGRECVDGFDKYYPGTKYFVKIYIAEEDWDKPYFDPTVKVKSKV